MNDKIYVIGHKSPDMDSVVSAIAYANFKNKLNNSTNYIPVVAGSVNKETEYVLERLSMDAPEILYNASGKKIILVDHNESTQTIDGIDSAEIIEVLDHHKVDFKYGDPIEFTVKPWGASATIIADKYIKNNIEIDKKNATLMLSAILIDTVITKSPTSTEKDREIITVLSSMAGLDDWKKYGMELFRIRSSVSKLSASEIIKSDFKDFNLSSGRFGIGQVETVDINDVLKSEDDIIAELDKLRESGGYHSVVLFVTDIIREGSKFLISTSDIDGMEKSLGEKIDGKTVYLDGVISRKKQVAPMMVKVFDK